ncbi:hypothetical protein KY332_03980 [Candidatus Woesearchaeota archaeon]|nr:hypothetical protein [Candidatus Woesearchaeota archaeon]
MGKGKEKRKAEKRAYKNRNKQKKKEPEVKKKSYWPWVLGGALFSIGAVSIGLYSLFKHDEHVIESTKIERSAEISFKEAVNNESLRQSYLEQLVEEESKVSEGWKDFGRVIYDPGLINLKKRTGGKDLERAREFSYDGSKAPEGMHLEALAMTRIEKKRVKPDCYVSEKCFNPKFACSEDELKSILDNEAFHALYNVRGKLQIIKNIKGLKRSEELNIMALELFSLDYQCFNLAEKGKRENVSKKFLKSFFETYFKLRQRFEEISKEDSDEGKFAKIIFDSLRVEIDHSTNAVRVKENFVGPSNFDFKQAVENENLRQAYLDKIVLEEAAKLKEWRCFDKIVYDYGFKQFTKDTGDHPDKGILKNKNYGEAVTKENIGIFNTKAITNVNDGYVVCYVSEQCFDYDSEDELKSLLDNEASNAYLAKKGAKLKNPSGRSDIKVGKRMMLMAHELFSFDYQFYKIVKKERKVSDEFRGKMLATYSPLYFEMVGISKKDDDEGAFAKAVIASLKCKINYKNPK